MFNPKIAEEEIVQRTIEFIHEFHDAHLQDYAECYRLDTSTELARWWFEKHLFTVMDGFNYHDRWINMVASASTPDYDTESWERDLRANWHTPSNQPLMETKFELGLCELNDRCHVLDNRKWASATEAQIAEANELVDVHQLSYSGDIAFELEVEFIKAFEALVRQFITNYKVGFDSLTAEERLALHETYEYGTFEEFTCGFWIESIVSKRHYRFLQAMHQGIQRAYPVEIGDRWLYWDEKDIDRGGCGFA